MITLRWRASKAVAQEFKMAFFHLVPRNDDTSDPCWTNSLLKEGCWIEVESEEKARRAVAIKTGNLNSPVESKIRISPY